MKNRWQYVHKVKIVNNCEWTIDNDNIYIDIQLFLNTSY